MISGSVELPLSFDILDAAVMECLPGYVRYGWVEFTREQITPASVVYRLRHDELGELGYVKLRKTSEHSSEMHISLPPQPQARSPTPEELESISTIPGREERLGAHAALIKKIWAERDERHRRQKEHQQRVIHAMFSRFEDDLAWEKAMGEGLEGVPRPAGQIARPLPSAFPKKGSTFDRYKEAYFIIKKMGEEYHRLYEDGATEEPMPKIDELRDALAADEKEGGMRWKPSGRTVRTIIGLGNDGFLQDEYREMVVYPNR